MTEKRKPSYDLAAFKRAFSRREKLAVTRSALLGAAALGFGRAEIVETIQGLSLEHFYKSMTAYGNPRLWQDVYHAPSSAGIVYLKFTKDILTDFLLLSFKKKEE